MIISLYEIKWNKNAQNPCIIKNLKKNQGQTAVVSLNWIYSETNYNFHSIKKNCMDLSWSLIRE